MSEKLKLRHMEILKALMTSTVPLDISCFEEKFNKSARTIRYDINDLRTLCEHYGVEICYQTKKGFFIPASQKLACSEILVEQKKQENTGFLLDSDKERCEKLLLYFFVQRKKVTAEQIAEQFFISRSTLIRLLGKMETYFGDKATITARKSGGYELTGDELVLRRAAAEIVAGQFRGSYTPEDWYLLLPEPLKVFFGLRDIIQLTNGIKKVNKHHNIWISNMAFLNLLSYCIVRNCRQQENGECGQGEEEVSEYAFDLLKEISFPGKEISLTEAAYLQEILTENSIAAKKGGLEPELIKTVMEEMLETLRPEIERQLGSVDFISLLGDLYGHLKNPTNLYRERPEQPDENEVVIGEVKENYFSYYQAARICADFMEEKLSIWLSETEVCYIAVYLYKNCEEKENKQKNVLVVCATGKGLSHLLSIRVERVFPMLKVVGQVSPYQLSYPNVRRDVDFIISTIPLTDSKIPVVKISRILSQEDILRIQEFLKYGVLVDEIPMKYKNEASFGAKTDPFALAEERMECGSQELTYAAGVISRLMLTLLEYTSKFPQRYQMSQDALLGLIIHMSMAVPRWYEGRTGEGSEEFVAEYANIRKNHREIYDTMEKFFELVENSLRVRIATEEKTAFFLYIIKEAEEN